MMSRYNVSLNQPNFNPRMEWKKISCIPPASSRRSTVNNNQYYGVTCSNGIPRNFNDSRSTIKHKFLRKIYRKLCILISHLHASTRIKKCIPGQTLAEDFSDRALYDKHFLKRCSCSVLFNNLLIKFFEKKDDDKHHISCMKYFNHRDKFIVWDTLDHGILDKLC